MPQFHSSSAALQAKLERVNQTLRDEAKAAVAKTALMAADGDNDPVMKHTIEDRCKPVIVSPKWISLECAHWSFNGGAHGLGMEYGRLFWLGDGDVRELRIADVLDEQQLARVSDVVLADLKKQDAEWVKSGEVTELTNKDLGTFVVDKRGVHFQFGPYHPYVQGQFTVSQSWSQWAERVPASSPLRAFAQAQVAAE